MSCLAIREVNAIIAPALPLRPRISGVHPNKAHRGLGAMFF